MSIRPIPSLLHRTIASLAMSSLFVSTLIACTPEDDPDALATTQASSDADDGVELRSAQDQMVAAIVADPVLYELIDLSVETMGASLIAQASMADEDLNATLVTINHPSYFEVVSPETFYANIGIPPSLAVQQQQVVAQLFTHHGLGALSSQQRSLVFAKVLEHEDVRSYLDGAIEYELNDIEGEIDTEIDDCEAACMLAYTAATASALTAYLAALVAGAAAGPAGVIAIAIASTAYFSALASAQKANDRCFAECNGEIDSGEECDSDLDCATDEFCWKGVLGIGSNECRPLKDEGNTCSRHGQCESGCCKLHVWTNPVSKTCRPASACN